MKKLVFLTVVLVLGWLTVAHAQVWVNPYTRKDGTQLQGHYRSNPDGNPHNNWSFPGNTNPHTGKRATGDPNRYLEQYQNRNDDHGSYGTNKNSYYQYQYRW
jgi:hypothetical protein